MQRRLGNKIALGEDASTGEKIWLPPEYRDKHTYICGSTGAGKSKLLEYLIRQDIDLWHRDKCGMLVIDPHGSLFDNVMKWCAGNKITAPILPIDLRRKDWTVSYNLLRSRPGSDPGVIVHYFVNAMAHVWGEAGIERTPLFGRWASNIVRALYENNLTLAEVGHLTDRTDIRSKQIRHALGRKVKDSSTVKDLAFLNELSPVQMEQQLGSTINRFHTFLKIGAMEAMFGQHSKSLDMRKVLDDGWIVLVSLASDGGNMTEEGGELFATLLLTDLWTAARERGKPMDSRDIKPFYVYVDEFQNFVTPTMSKQLSEARGFGLHLTMSHQFPRQLVHKGQHGEELLDSVMGNTRTKVAFQMSHPEDMRRMAELLFMGTMSPDKIKHMLTSTKVMGYVEELRRSEGGTTSTSTAWGMSSSTGQGFGSNTSERMSEHDEILDMNSGTNDSESFSESESRSKSRGTGRSWNEGLVNLPVMGQEVSGVQFEPLDEQIYRNVAVLYDQKQRQAIARLPDTTAPVSIQTPTVKPAHYVKQIVDDYTVDLLKKSGCALPIEEAMKAIEERKADFELQYLNRAVAEPKEWEIKQINPEPQKKKTK